ncbi:hypothetical protein CEQ07_05080 [Oligella urethralis]|uniref:DEAD/DEAH box helicase n=1 Tax=Oligella urethralis TaxID=90245 RepID=UPI000CFE5297|nr:DEAD/DEAH box helicase [Oligella urethralis]AVL70841.1 hypothetical protein CEQ07_05080 [Oligella urethralis]
MSTDKYGLLKLTGFNFRPYQLKAITDVLDWFQEAKTVGVPLVEIPTGGGKSWVIAGLACYIWNQWRDYHPRTIVIVPSKELAEQNAEKLRALLPDDISVGYFSASLGRRDKNADVIVATIGSIARHAHLFDDVRFVIIDEAHLISNKGTGQYREFLADLANYTQYATVGLTATPFRGDGVSITTGKDPLFTAICHQTSINELLDDGYLSPLVLPEQTVDKLDVEGVRMAQGDYAVKELGERVNAQLPAIVSQTLALASNRKKWIAFTPTVENAEGLVKEFKKAGVTATVVTGRTKKAERADAINAFRGGEVQCLVTVLALAVGFDVPDVDCIIWARNTTSPVLYVQGAGRGLRIAPNKTDCLWLDFTDTTERLGPLDTIKGKAYRETSGGGGPGGPKTCPACHHEVIPADSHLCQWCGFEVNPRPEPPKVSKAQVLSSNVVEPQFHVITSTSYFVHIKQSTGAQSLRVDYHKGLSKVASEWISFESTNNWARQRAVQWWEQNTIGNPPFPETALEAEITLKRSGCYNPPIGIFTVPDGKYKRITGYRYREVEEVL